MNYAPQAKSRFSGQYPRNWNEIAKQVKEEADWRCVRCGHPHEPATGHTLTVHHLTGQKDQCAWWNIPALCQRCHLKIQAKVVMHRQWYLPHSDWFKPYVAGYYAHVHGLPDDKESVLANMDALIALGQQKPLTPADVSELAAYWPGMPDLEGVDVFAATCGEPYGEEP
jgi:hypothetical protein